MCIRDSINDVWSESTDTNGQPVMIRNTLYIPEGKKPLIFSYDDVNYYDYMLKDGFTYKLIDRKSTRLNSSHITRSRMPSSA